MKVDKVWAISCQWATSMRTFFSSLCLFTCLLDFNSVCSLCLWYQCFPSSNVYICFFLLKILYFFLSQIPCSVLCVTVAYISSLCLLFSSLNLSLSALFFRIKYEFLLLLKFIVQVKRSEHEIHQSYFTI